MLSLQLRLSLGRLLGAQRQQAQVAYVPQAFGEVAGHLVQEGAVRQVADRKLRAPEHEGLVLEHLRAAVYRDDAQEVRLLLE